MAKPTPMEAKSKTVNLVLHNPLSARKNPPQDLRDPVNLGKADEERGGQTSSRKPVRTNQSQDPIEYSQVRWQENTQHADSWKQETGMNLRTRLARKNWCWRWTQRQSFTTWWSQITNTWRRFSNFRKRSWESLQVAQHLQWKQWRPMFWYGVVHVFVNESRHSSWHELIGDPGGLQEYELRGNSELIQYHTETDIGAFWRNSECEHDWKYISLMDEIDIVSWSSDPLNKAKVRVFSDSAVSGEDVISKRSSCKMGRSSGVNLDVRFFWELLGIDGEAIESEWNVFPGFTSLQIFQKIQNNLQERNIDPEKFRDRIIFLSMFNDIDWTRKGNGEICTGRLANLGPFSSLKTRNGPPLGPPLRSEWALLGGPRDQNFDAGPSRDLNFDLLSWFWASPLGGQKTSKCEHSKNQINHVGDRPKKHVVWSILFQEFASHRRKSAHHKMHIFRNFGSLNFCTVFFHLRHGRRRERENTGGSKSGVWDPLAHFEVEGGRNFGSGYVSQNSRFCHVLSFSVVPSVSVESVMESVMLSYFWHQTAFLIERGSKIFHPNVEFSPSFFSTIDRNSEIWMPRTLEKKGRSKFRRNTGRSSVLDIKRIGLENQSTFLKESEIQWLHRWFSDSRKQVTQSLQVPVLRVVEFWERWKEKKPCTSMRILQTQNSCSEPFVLWIGSAFTEQFRIGVNSSAWQKKKRDKRSHKNPWPKMH